MSSAEIASRLAITDVLHKYCRGLDRMDRELTLSCWHPDGTDDHAPLYVGSATGFVEWVWPVHAAMELTRHRLSNIVIDLKGDEAGTECYWDLTFRTHRDGLVFDTRSGGRYVDTFARRDGRWAITHRRSIREWARTDPVVNPADPARGQIGIDPCSPGAPVTHPARDRSDYSYTVLTR